MALLGIEEGIQAFMFPMIFAAIANPNYDVRLYTNNHTPAASDNLVPLNTAYVECADAAYAAVEFISANWVFSSIAGPVAQAAYPTITFTFATAASIYGYYITDHGAGGTKACIAEKFSGAPIAFSATSPLYLTILITLS